MAYGDMTDAQKRQSPMADKKKNVKTVKKPITKKTKTLTKAMEMKLKKHLNHTAGHMKMMEKLILDGETFKKAHEMTLKSIGN